MTNPRLSVLTPTYNCGNLILRSYECLCRQDLTEWEWVVVDDGSDDDSHEVLSDIAVSDQRVKIYTLEKNQGRGYARNFGLSKCNADAVVIWDVDDFYLPTRLTEISTAFNAGYDYFCSYVIVVDNKIGLKGARHFLYNRGPFVPDFVHPTLAFKKTCLNRTGYDETMRAGEDLGIMVTLKNNFKGYYAKNYLMLYVEDREINLEKTRAMHRSHIASIKKLIKMQLIPVNNKERLRLFFGLHLKSFLLMLLRLAPSAYPHSVNLRHREHINGKLLTDDHLFLFKKFSTME